MTSKIKFTRNILGKLIPKNTPTKYFGATPHIINTYNYVPKNIVDRSLIITNKTSSAYTCYPICDILIMNKLSVLSYFDNYFKHVYINVNKYKLLFFGGIGVFLFFN